MKGGRIKGCFVPMPRIDESKPVSEIVICEGYATGASIAKYYKQDAPVWLALNAGNLQNVAESMRAFYPDEKIIIACDLDKPQAGEKYGIGEIKVDTLPKLLMAGYGCQLYRKANLGILMTWLALSFKMNKTPTPMTHHQIGTAYGRVIRECQKLGGQFVTLESFKAILAAQIEAGTLTREEANEQYKAARVAA